MVKKFKEEEQQLSFYQMKSKDHKIDVSKLGLFRRSPIPVPVMPNAAQL
jgi:hypothetical protein